MATVPDTMKAVVVLEQGGIAVQEHPVPAIGDDDILVKTVAVAQNPTDYKFIDSGRANPGAVVGCDWSGHVVRVGRRVSTLRVGAHVAGFVMGSTFPDSGAFAEYLRTPAELAWAVPAHTLSHEQAATLGVAFCTVGQAFYHPKRLALPELPAQVPGKEWMYIHGGASAVGQFAIQLAVLSGYTVATTASPKNHSLVKALGAAAVFDYRDAEVVSAVKAATGDAVRVAFDTISLRDSQRISAAVIAPAGGRVMHLLAVIPDATDRTDVQRDYTLLYSSSGRAYTYRTGQHTPAVPEDRAQIVEFLKKVPGLVEAGQIKPLPTKVWEGGLDGIPGGLQYMREGKVSAEKIVYRI